MKVSISKAKSKFSQIIKYVMTGQEVIILKNNKPVAKIISFQEKREQRKPGIWQGKILIKNDFDELPDSFMKHFR